MTATEARRRIVLERSYPAPVKAIWELWTTARGLEAWWGPGGFAVKVHSIDLRPGGLLEYSMTAVAPETMAFLQSRGRPTESRHRITYVEVNPLRRLSFDHLVDFIPGMAPYETHHQVEFFESPGGGRIVVTLDPMHDEEMTRMAQMGWSQELDRLGRLLTSVRE